MWYSMCDDRTGVEQNRSGDGGPCASGGLGTAKLKCNKVRKIRCKQPITAHPPPPTRKHACRESFLDSD